MNNKLLDTILLSVLMLLVMTACNKAVVNFGEESFTDDPNIIYLDTLTINMSTYQTDSFNTSGDTVFIVGNHTDEMIGGYESKAFFQLGIPLENGLQACTNCIFDSIAVITKFNGNFFGDTTSSFVLRAHRLSQQMIPDQTSIGYNTSAFEYEETPLSQLRFDRPRPSSMQNVSLKLPDDFGQDLFSMLKRNSDTIATTDKFQKYLNGFVLTGEADNGKTIYHFGLQDVSVNCAMRLYYRTNGQEPAAKSIDFPISPSSYQFNSFTYNKAGTPLAVFTPKKKQILSSSLTDNKSYLHSNSGLFPHINIPGIFALKELHPYIKVIKAVLEITPSASNYASSGYYRLPEYIGLYEINDAFTISGWIVNSSSEIQDGGLIIDYLLHKDTKYTYDLTAYVNNILNTGRSANQSLLLYPLTSSGDNRMILDAASGRKSVQLKIYVLGL